MAGTIFFLVLATAAWAQRIEFTWPTPNHAFDEGKTYEAWVQPTVSGEPESGLFGCIRSHGAQFHEGLDIRPVSRDSHGEPADQVMAAMDGIVKHVSTSPGASNYGRYIVIEHPGVSPAVYTLYAHLARIEPGIAAGTSVHRGQVIATMGRSSSTMAIPRERAHLHFEIGVLVTQEFGSWYAWKKFGSPNEQGLYNGMNLMGVDPLDFLKKWRTHRIDNFQQYFDSLRPVVTFRIATTRVPDFITRYPALMRKPMSGPLGGWEVDCNATGVPYAWTPLSPLQVAGVPLNTVQITSVDTAAIHSDRCKSLVHPRGTTYVPGSDLSIMLQQVFGLR